ncbi:hypothetical protein PFISCL1PPCAC_10657 [Pristionchus fissidentatus]|uniref:Uncharacterized protein n=1 Tax=Pristionchus fissidentatus TaxID=1538716 RepID=A0AAV5VL41_9BILA|nr:hypothetical protein PFISCL1PPCAC_10657 [Pristionchus fissidentatus]
MHKRYNRISFAENGSSANRPFTKAEMFLAQRLQEYVIIINKQVRGSRSRVRNREIRIAYKIDQRVEGNEFTYRNRKGNTRLCEIRLSRFICLLGLLYWRSQAILNELEIGNVPLGIDSLGNGLDVSAEFVLDAAESVTVFVGDEVDGDTEVTEATRPSDSVKISLSIAREIEVDHNIDGLDVDTTSEEIGADKVAAVALKEVVENSVTMILSHLGVNVVTGISELGDLLGEQLYTLGAVAEDDRLVDLELAEQRVQTMDFLLLLHICVVLRNSEKGEFLHQIDFVRLAHVLLHEVRDGKRECSRIEHYLSLLGHERDETIENSLEVLRQKLVSLVEDKNVAIFHVSDSLLHQIENTSRGGDHEMNGSVEAHDVITEISASSGNHDLEFYVLAQLNTDLRSLESQFSGGNDDHGLDLLLVRIDLLYHGDTVRSGLSGSILGTSEDILA